MKKKKGFTLVELLAVIVILAVILVIAVPKIMDTIQNSKEGTLMSSAKLIASQAEKKYVENQVLGINDYIGCDDVVKTTDDYDYCDISFDSDGKANVTIVGKDKFEGMAICGGTKTEASISDNCYTDSACFTYQDTSVIENFTINVPECKSYFVDYFWDLSTDADITAYCNNERPTQHKYTLQEDLDRMDLEYEDLENNDVINIEYVNGIEVTGYDTSCGPDVWVPDNLENKMVVAIGEYAFYNNNVVTYNDNNNNHIHNNIFQLNNTSYKTDIMPIEYMFNNDWNGVTNIKFPKEIRTIGSYSFQWDALSGELDLSYLTKLKHIGYRAFIYNDITSVKLPENIVRIDSEAFNYTSIRSIEIPESVYYIGSLAFVQTNAVNINILKHVKLNNPDTKIGNCAFGNLRELETHNIPVNDYRCI